MKEATTESPATQPDAATLPAEAMLEPALVRRVIESLLFVSDGALEVEKLRRILALSETDVHEAIRVLERESEGRGLRIQRHGDSVQMVTAPEAAPYVEQLLGVQAAGKLSAAALETLAIVAYRQPVTRAAIEAIRGVSADRAVSTLESRGLIAETGRLDTVGRPILYGTTFEFLEYFGLSSLADLPPLREES